MLSRSLVYVSLLFAACAFASCSTGGNVKSPTLSAPPANTMAEDDTQRPGPPANDAPPDVVVRQLYKQHDSYAGPFFQTKDRALVDRYFTKQLADLIWQDSITSKGAVGAIDIDPVYGAQLLQLKNFQVGNASIRGDTATVTATFENYEADSSVTFELKKDDGIWKIDDIKYKGGDTLMKKLTKK